MSARSLTVIGVVVIAFALFMWIINSAIHEASFGVLIVALVAGFVCFVLGIADHEVGPGLSEQHRRASV